MFYPRTKTQLTVTAAVLALVLVGGLSLLLDAQEDACLPLTAGEVAQLLTTFPGEGNRQIRTWTVRIPRAVLHREGNVTHTAYPEIRASRTGCGSRVSFMIFAGNVRTGNSFAPSFSVNVDLVNRPVLPGGGGERGTR